jgi:hypothetical protein
MTYGSIDEIRELLHIDKGEEEDRIIRLRAKANTWLNNFAPSIVISTLDNETKDSAVESYTVYLFRLASDSFVGDVGATADKWEDEAIKLLKRAINSDAKTYEIYKVNKVG